MTEQALVRTIALSKVFAAGEHRLVAVDRVDFTLARGEFVSIMGPSGSGKSTFMHIIGCLDRPTSGTYLFDGVDVSTIDADARAALRRAKLGFVFQAYNLLPRTSAIENAELPMIYAGLSSRERRDRAVRALLDAGLEERHHLQPPSELSGGQQQRVAIARALVNQPELILADEPTGALDTKTSGEIMTLFQGLNRARGLSVLMVTHEASVARYSQRIVSFLDGRIVNDVPTERYVAGSAVE
ncbi:MAG: ABC transporter ATP-binding protein [bacterium]|nr:ABC transporter ATP-binding protein [bacterium]